MLSAAIVIAFLIAWPWWDTPHHLPDAEALLKRSDTYRNGWPSFILRVKITNFESGKSGRRKTLRGLAKRYR